MDISTYDSVRGARRQCFQDQGARRHGHVNCAAPKILSCEPPSGFIFEEDPVPARTVAVPVKPGTDCANPFWSTAAPGFMFPTHMPLFEPTHHVTSWLVSGTGDGGLLKAPLAANETWPSGKFRASAEVGVRATDCNWRPLPNPRSRAYGSTRKSGRKPKQVLAVSILRSRFPSGYQGQQICCLPCLSPPIKALLRHPWLVA
jgi:hypothetical protein